MEDPTPTLALPPSRGSIAPPLNFAIRVKHDPHRLLKGGFLAELRPGCLILRRGKQRSIDVPLPASAYYLGGNQFWITVGDRDVTFSVASLSLYRERFARVVVELACGRAKTANLADYSIPRFATILSYMPVIGFGPFLTSGGAIGGLLFGGPVALLCLWNLVIFQQERWRLAYRTALVLLLSTLSSAASLSLFAVLLKSASEGPGAGTGSPASVQLTKAPAPSTAIRPPILASPPATVAEGPAADPAASSQPPPSPPESGRVRPRSVGSPVIPSRLPLPLAAWRWPKILTPIAALSSAERGPRSRFPARCMISRSSMGGEPTPPGS